jgi:cell division protein FtsN
VNAQADDWMVKAMAARRQQPSSAAHPDINAAPPPPPPPPPPKDFGNQPASASPGPYLHPGQVSDSEKFWQVTGDGSVTAGALLGQLLGKGFHPKLVGTPEAAWVMVGPYSNEEALNKAKAALEAAGVRPLRVW